jgi:hypothetical protein
MLASACIEGRRKRERSPRRTAFLRLLRTRGLTGGQFVISDHHAAGSKRSPRSWSVPTSPTSPWRFSTRPASRPTRRRPGDHRLTRSATSDSDQAGLAPATPLRKTPPGQRVGCRRWAMECARGSRGDNRCSRVVPEIATTCIRSERMNIAGDVRTTITGTAEGVIPHRATTPDCADSYAPQEFTQATLLRQPANLVTC